MLLDIAPLDWASITTALLCGAIIGFERQLSGKPAGIRTSIMICLGTYLFVVAGTSLIGDSVDPSRIIGQVVTGIGFLGAGVILSREGIVIGVTSAAVIWVLAGIGVMVGLRNFHAAITLSVISVGVLVGVNILEHSFLALQRGVHGKIHLPTKPKKKGQGE